MNDIGYLYVIGDGPKIKIGKSASPEARTKTLVNICGIKNPKVFISNECSSMSQKESLCHKYYSQLRVHGEWFYAPFSDAVEAVTMVVGREDLTAKKNNDVIEHKKSVDKGSEFIGRMMSNNKGCSDAFNSLFKDTLELINICEDDHLINELMSVNGSNTKLLIVRCSALMDVINQQRKIIEVLPCS